MTAQGGPPATGAGVDADESERVPIFGTWGRIYAAVFLVIMLLLPRGIIPSLRAAIERRRDRPPPPSTAETPVQRVAS